LSISRPHGCAVISSNCTRSFNLFQTPIEPRAGRMSSGVSGFSPGSVQSRLAPVKAGPYWFEASAAAHLGAFSLFAALRTK
jgi:hypothetical protein